MLKRSRELNRAFAGLTQISALAVLLSSFYQEINNGDYNYNQRYKWNYHNFFLLNRNQNGASRNSSRKRKLLFAMKLCPFFPNDL